MSSFAIYMKRQHALVGALAYGAYVLGLAAIWIGIGVVMFLGFGLMGAARKSGKEEQAGR